MHRLSCAFGDADCYDAFFPNLPKAPGMGVVSTPVMLRTLSFCLSLAFVASPEFLLAQKAGGPVPVKKGGWVPPITPSALRDALATNPDASAISQLHDKVMRAFGKENLMQGRAGARVDGTTVMWAIIAAHPAKVVHADGTLLGEMRPLSPDGLQVLVEDQPNFSEVVYRIEVQGNVRAAGTVRIEHAELGPDSQPKAGVPKGELKTFVWDKSIIFPGTVRTVTVYLPPGFQADKEQCLMVWQDGSRHVDPAGQMRAGVVFDNLIHAGHMPSTVGVFIDPGRNAKQKEGDKAANRGFEYDSLGDAYVRFLLTEILPEVENRYQVKFINDPRGWGIAGGSSGGICSFTAAWERPDKFNKVLSWVGSFVDLKGGHVYPYLIRKTERKPIRVYLLDGENDLDNKFGNWPLANKMMEASLRYMQYDYRMDWTKCFHGSKGMAPMLPEALRWLWRDWKETVGG